MHCCECAAAFAVAMTPRVHCQISSQATCKTMPCSSQGTQHKTDGVSMRRGWHLVRGKGAHRTAASCAFCFVLRCLDLGFNPVSLMNFGHAASVGLRSHIAAASATAPQQLALSADDSQRWGCVGGEGGGGAHEESPLDSCPPEQDFVGAGRDLGEGGVVGEFALGGLQKRRQRRVVSLRAAKTARLSPRLHRLKAPVRLRDDRRGLRLATSVATSALQTAPERKRRKCTARQIVGRC